ncbi:hypothetical protein QUB68_15565 [Microcoleus sp. A006_D1]|uniref:hypothetical protein n=1 Tax=Microcoleus sp. A006_D1 TaxID=3055267 RepID=UPI002FD02724
MQKAEVVMYHTQKCFESIASDITMSNLSNIPGGGGLPDRFRNVGDQIQQYFDFAETDPDGAVPWFANILKEKALLTTRALALQGLGRAAQHAHIKQDLADWDVLKDIAKEVNEKGDSSRDLTRWAAAKLLEDIGYSPRDLQHREGGGFTEPVDRIRREIRDRKLVEINRIQRLNTTGETTAEYDRNRDFWVYGPVEELFAGDDNSPNYQELVGDVVHELHGRGVYLGLMSPNSIVQEAALRQAGLIFKESAEIEEFIYGLLEDFLTESSHEMSLRIVTAEIISNASDLKKLTTLSKLLLEDEQLRNVAVKLLIPYKEQNLAEVEPDANTVLVALEYKLDIDRPEPENLTIQQIETHISSSMLNQNDIPGIFLSAIESAKNLPMWQNQSSTLLVKFLEDQSQINQSNISEWIKKLEDQKSKTLEIQQKVKFYQSQIEKTISAIENNLNIHEKIKTIPNLEARNSNEYENYNQCKKLEKNLSSVKDKLLSEMNSKYSELINKSKNMGGENAWGFIKWGLGVIALGFFVIVPISKAFQSQNSSSSGSSISTSYTMGFPKSTCGSSSTPNKCWYPVFIKYSDSNWNTVISNYCTDIESAQSLETAKKQGQIQVASFGNSNDAQGFANYMQSQFRSGSVGKQKCY